MVLDGDYLFSFSGHPSPTIMPVGFLSNGTSPAMQFHQNMIYLYTCACVCVPVCLCVCLYIYIYIYSVFACTRRVYTICTVH